MAFFCFVMFLGAGLVRLYHLLLDSPWLRLAEIEISGLKQLDRNEILNTMGLERGECTLNIRTGSVAERLRKIPTLKDASVRLEAHHRLVVEIVEREPVAVLRCGDNDMKMDVDGVLFSRAEGDENRSVPLITGICDPNLKLGDHISKRSQARIMELMSAIDHSGSWLSGTAINECNWNENGFTLVLGERAVPIDIGTEGFEQKLTKLRKVITTLNDRQWTEMVDRIDLDYPGKAYLQGRFPVPKPAQEHSKKSS